MNEREIYLTPEGADSLRSELEELSGPHREALAKRLRHAVQQGDLSENADYITAKEAQGFLEGRIQEIETILRQAVIVDNSGKSDQVGVGSVVVVSLNGGQPETFRVVGIKEASPRQGKISHESPIGQALVGKRVGDIAEASTPGGKLTLRILEIR